MIMNIDIKTYSYSKIKTFVNLRYLSMRIPDLIFKMLSYFAYNFLMVLIITFQIFMMQVNPFEGFSVFDDRVVPFLITAGILSCIMSIVTVFIYHYKTKWSVILNRGVTFFYVSITMLLLSCFIEFKITAFNAIYAIFKIAIYVLSYFIYVKYLFEKKLPKIEEIVHNGRSFPAGMIAGALTIAIKPVISLLGQNGGLSTATFNDFIAFFEYLIAVCLIVNMVDAFVKAYYAKIYNIN
jgi:hypothetical protein